MGLLTQTLTFKVNSNMKKYYTDKGYLIDENGMITIDIADLPKNSNKRVMVQCDNCKKIYDIEYISCSSRINNLFCKDCKQIKFKQTCLEKYGVENVFQVQSIKDKQKQTCLEKYGFENVFQNENVKQKSKDTIKQRYGVSHIMHIDEVKSKVIEKGNKTKFINGSQTCSKQQKYIHSLYGGILNYNFDKLWLDIFFEKDLIYFEYNGSGHDLDVKLNKISQHQFNIKEIKRYKFLKTKNLKQFVFISKKDKLPSIEVLISMKEMAFDILKQYDYIIFDFDLQTIKFNNEIIDYNFDLPIQNNIYIHRND